MAHIKRLTVVLFGLLLPLSVLATTPNVISHHDKFYSQEEMSAKLLKDNPYQDVTLTPALLSLAKQQCACAAANVDIISGNAKIAKDSCLVTLTQKIILQVDSLAKDKKDPKKYREALIAKMILQSEKCQFKHKKSSAKVKATS